MKRILKYIDSLLGEYTKAIELDHQINCDAYENVARYKVAEKIKKFIFKQMKKESETKKEVKNVKRD